MQGEAGPGTGRRMHTDTSAEANPSGCVGSGWCGWALEFSRSSWRGSLRGIFKADLLGLRETQLKLLCFITDFYIPETGDFQQNSKDRPCTGH